MQARTAGLAAYPYQLIKGSKLDPSNPQVVKNTHSTPDGREQFYVRDPHRPDHNDPADILVGEGQEATDQAWQQWQLLAGYAVRVDEHKTGAKYPCWIWLSQINMAYMLCYEKIAYNYMKDQGIPITLESPFFIRSKGIVKKNLLSKKNCLLVGFCDLFVFYLCLFWCSYSLFFPGGPIIHPKYRLDCE